MIGIVIVAHGGLAREYLAAVEHVVGPQSGIRAIAIEEDHDRAAKQAEICAAADAVDAGMGVVVVTDLFGGSPSNLSLMACAQRSAAKSFTAPTCRCWSSSPNRATSRCTRRCRRRSMPGANTLAATPPRTERQMTVVRQLTIVNEKGLHARASAKFVELVEAHDARAEVEKDGERVSGNSIMGLLMLGRREGKHRLC